MKKNRFLLLYLLMISCQGAVLAVCDIMYYTWQYWAIILSTIFGAIFFMEAFTK